MTALFRELLTRRAVIRRTGEPGLVDSNFDNRVGSLPLSMGPTVT